jgi:hypothetical protein
MDSEESRLLELLDKNHRWPCVFAFKFIVPAAQGPALEALIPEADSKEARPSSQGKYTAYTFHCAVSSGREVLAVYARVKGIPGLVSL